MEASALTHCHKDKTKQDKKPHDVRRLWQWHDRKNHSAYCPSLSGAISSLTRNVITLPSLFHTAVSRIVFSLIKGVAATPRLNCKQDTDRNAQADRSVC